MATAEQNLSNYPSFTFKGVSNLRIGIVWAEWNSDITENLKSGAEQFLIQCGIKPENLFVQSVPGSFELPLAAQWQLKQLEVDGVICLGSVIKGETDHFHYVCSAVSQGIKDVALKMNKPVIFGVLTDNTKQQALDRSGGKHGNKGIEAAATMLKMLQIQQTLY